MSSLKILKTLDVEKWKDRLRCGHCKTRFEVVAADIEKDKFKVSGYHFNGTAVIKLRFYALCPVCNKPCFLDPPTPIKLVARQYEPTKVVTDGT